MNSDVTAVGYCNRMSVETLGCYGYSTSGKPPNTSNSDCVCEREIDREGERGRDREKASNPIVATLPAGDGTRDARGEIETRRKRIGDERVKSKERGQVVDCSKARGMGEADLCERA